MKSSMEVNVLLSSVYNATITWKTALSHKDYASEI